MQQKLNNILKELYIIDPSLKSREDDLKKVLKYMIWINPKVKIDDSFKNKLKNKIIKKTTKKSYKNFSIKNNFVTIFSFVFSWLLALSLGVFVFTTYFSWNNTINTLNEETISISSFWVRSLDIESPDFKNEWDMWILNNDFWIMSLEETMVIEEIQNKNIFQRIIDYIKNFF